MIRRPSICLPGHCPSHCGLRVVCTELYAYSIPKSKLLLHAHFNTVHYTLTQCSQFLLTRVLLRRHLPCLKVCMSFLCCLEPCGLEDFDDFSAQTASLCQTRQIQKPPTGHAEDLQDLRLKKMSSVFEGISAGKIFVRSRYSLRPSNIEPVWVYRTHSPERSSRKRRLLIESQQLAPEHDSPEPALCEMQVWVL